MLVWTLLYFFNFTLRTRKYSRLLGQTTPEIFKLKPEGVERRKVPPVFQHWSQMLRLLSFVAPASVSGEPETILLDIRQKRSNQFFLPSARKRRLRGRWSTDIRRLQRVQQWDSVSRHNPWGCKEGKWSGLNVDIGQQSLERCPQIRLDPFLSSKATCN